MYSMIQVNIVDEQGFIIEPEVVFESDVLLPNRIKTPVPEGFYTPQWTGEVWIEGMAEEEIQAILDKPIPKSPLDILGEQLVQKDIEIMQLNDTLGRQVVDHDIRLMMGGL